RLAPRRRGVLAVFRGEPLVLPLGGLGSARARRARGVIERAFGRRSPRSVGGEEGIMLLDGETFELVPASSELIEGAGELEHGLLKTELFASVVELTTEPCDTVVDAADALRGLRR